MENRHDHSEHEEAIVPVKPGLRLQSASPPAATSASAIRGEPRPLLIGATVVLAAAVVGVFFVLPRWVERNDGPSAAEPGPAAVAPAPAEPAAPALTEEQIAELTAEADALLAQLLTQQQRLTSLSVESWGEEGWQRYQALSRAGDDAYLADAYHDAIARYGEALAVGDELLERSGEITARALEAGRRALEAGNAEVAIAQFDLVLTVEQDNEEAGTGRARAERLPEVLASMQRAEELRQRGELEEAAGAYREALAIDAAWAPAAGALESVERMIADRHFEALMSDGLRALGEERYEDAGERFRAALAMRPDSAEARDGIMQAEQGMHLDQIALAEARALAFERRELWQEAIRQYEAALETDDSLAFAKTGLERARARADLDAKLENLIENPSLLFGDAVLASAAALVEEARAIASPGEAAAASSDSGGNVRLAQQIDRLSQLIAQASTPVKVELRSDQMTEVTLYRVGALGVFSAREVELRPGSYTAIGSRDGYRDVRKTFTVLPGRDVEPISVICSEPI